MQVAALAGQEVGEHRFVQQRVAERVVVVLGDDEVVGHRLAEGGRERRLLDGTDRGERGVANAAPADGGRAQDDLGVAADAVDAGQQQLADSVREAAGPGRGGELLGEERVAVRPLEHLAGELGSRAGAEDALQLLGEVGRAEGLQPQVLDAVGPLQLGQHGPQRVTAEPGRRGDTWPTTSREGTRGPADR